MLVSVGEDNFGMELSFYPYSFSLGRPSGGGLTFPEYVIYRGEQAYPGKRERNCCVCLLLHHINHLFIFSFLSQSISSHIKL